MSKKAAKIGLGLIDAITLPLNKRQRGKARAHMANALMTGTYDVIETKRGPLKLYGGRGSTIASTVANWEKDEPETRFWIENYVQSGETLWDIGANVGIFSIYAAMKEGVQVIGFEPSSLNYALLSEHLALNGMSDKITILPVAFSDHQGIETLYFKSSEQGAACNGLGGAETQFGEYEAQFQHAALSYTVDGFLETFDIAAPDHIKLDVDGIEALILKGATKTLKKVKSLIAELEGKNENNPEIEKIIQDAGLVEDPSINEMGDGRNKLYVRA
jgi:FkbM family methyltransferase